MTHGCDTVWKSEIVNELTWNSGYQIRNFHYEYSNCTKKKKIIILSSNISPVQIDI